MDFSIAEDMERLRNEMERLRNDTSRESANRISSIAELKREAYQAQAERMACRKERQARNIERKKEVQDMLGGFRQLQMERTKEHMERSKGVSDILRATRDEMAKAHRIYFGHHSSTNPVSFDLPKPRASKEGLKKNKSSGKQKHN